MGPQAIAPGQGQVIARRRGEVSSQGAALPSPSSFGGRQIVDLLRRRSRPDPAPAPGPDLGSARAHPGRGCRAKVQAGSRSPGCLPTAAGTAPLYYRLVTHRGRRGNAAAFRGRLRRPAVRRAPAAARPIILIWDNLTPIWCMSVSYPVTPALTGGIIGVILSPSCTTRCTPHASGLPHSVRPRLPHRSSLRTGLSSKSAASITRSALASSVICAGLRPPRRAAEHARRARPVPIGHAAWPPDAPPRPCRAGRRSRRPCRRQDQRQRPRRLRRSAPRTERGRELLITKDVRELVARALIAGLPFGHAAPGPPPPSGREPPPSGREHAALAAAASTPHTSSRDRERRATVARKIIQPGAVIAVALQRCVTDWAAESTLVRQTQPIPTANPQVNPTARPQVQQFDQSQVRSRSRSTSSGPQAVRG